MPSSAQLMSLTTSYGVWAVFVVTFLGALGIGLPVPVQGLLLGLGALAGRPGGLALWSVALAAIAGQCLGHVVDYSAGRVGHRFVGRLQRWTQQRVPQDSWLRSLMSSQRRRALVVFTTRFVLSPLASPVSVIAGLSLMDLFVYLVAEVAGEMVFIAGNLALGWALGGWLLSRPDLVPVFWLAILALALLPLGLVRVALHFRPRTRPATAPGAEPEPAITPHRG